MVGKHARTRLLILGAVFAWFPGVARGQVPQIPDGGICTAERQRLSKLEESLAASEAALKVAEAHARQANQDLAASERRVAECGKTVSACEVARDTYCRGISGTAESVIAGRAPPSDLSSCLPEDRRVALASLLSSWSRTTAGLGALLDYALGQRDTPPRNAGTKVTDAEKALTRLLAGGKTQAPLMYRRLLVGALERIAPTFWRRLRGAGGSAVEAWFQSTERLDADLIAEARRGAEAALGPPGFAGPPLAAALKYVQTYLDLAGCEALASGAHDCGRARQLQALLESSGPLVTQRREQLIWASDCRTIGPSVILDWLQDFPSSQPAIGGTDWAKLTNAAFEKLYACFLNDPAAGPSYAAWVEQRFPGPQQVGARILVRLEAIRAHWKEGGEADLCVRAVRSLQTLPKATSCALPERASRPLDKWLPRKEHHAGDNVTANRAVRTCDALLHVLWQGKSAEVPASLAHPPTATELVKIDANAPATPVAELRAACARRDGAIGQFPDSLRLLAGIAGRMEESVAASPWLVDPATLAPLEQVRYERARTFGAWVRHLLSGTSRCEALGLAPARCDRCTTSPEGRYDCALLAALDSNWENARNRALASLGAIISLGLFLAWLMRFRAAWREFGPAMKAARMHVQGLALVVRRDPLRFLLPSRLRHMTIDLPPGPDWQRWGHRATIVRAQSPSKVSERDVNLAASIARQAGAEFSLLVHSPEASPDLPAVRAMLEWAARGATRSVQIVPLSEERLRWARTADDLLDLVEQTSLRGNPFELRGRITSASQFFNRERLVSGLLAGVQAGRWMFVGGLRRFGKSSLALEVARRLPGPSGYVDLAGFYHEIAILEDRARAADAIIRYLTERLVESAVARYPEGSAIPEALGPGEPLDSGTIAEWFRRFTAACAAAGDGRTPPILVILDELEQAIGVGPERLAQALDVLSILMGRLRTALGGAPPLPGTPRIGVLLCGALHPLLWAPLPSLAGQSLMGAFESVFVTSLTEQTASAMMRGLGARQGIRFTEPALQMIVREAQGIPLLVRRLGSSVLELYDPERARQGSLGSVEIGVEGARAAVRREEDDGSPLRVWVESEIGDAQSPAGTLLRALAGEGRLSVHRLREVAAIRVMAHFDDAGISRLLAPEECRRRALEAASVIVRMLGETGLLVPIGDLMNPDEYEFADGIVRRILADRRATSVFGL